MFGFARSIGCSLVFVLWVVNFDDAFGTMIQIKRPENRWFGSKSGNFSVHIFPGTEASEKTVLHLAGCNITMNINVNATPAEIKIAGQENVFRTPFKIKVYAEQMIFNGMQEHDVGVSACKPKYVKSHGLNFINVKVDQNLPRDFMVELGAKEMLLSDPSAPSIHNSTTPHNKGAEVVSSMGFGSMAVFVLLAVRVF
ncbi:hypothetical protein M3Y98_00090800 [Aphelenchoides besseyi]|nr:hypothetical protein M3Y98_00090800 [Aphelenchoides besseyi]KAI6198509.1 hypothetical protein M3Y96_00526500 [Aphelenchoides besseyi]